MTAATPQPGPPGLDLDRLTAWFSTSVPGTSGDLTARLTAGGRSNLTYEVTNREAAWRTGPAWPAWWTCRRRPLGR